MNKTRRRKSGGAPGKAPVLVALALGAALAAVPAAGQTPFANAMAQHLARADSRAEALPVAAFYQAAQQQPVWHSAERVEALARALETLENDGLDPADYLRGPLNGPLKGSLGADGGGQPLAQAFARSRDDAEARAAFDVRATRALLLALDHLQRGRVDPEQQVPGWETARPARSYSMARVVAAVNSADIEQALSLARPDLPAYEALREALGAHRALAERASAPLVPAGDDALRRGDEGDAVTALRRRLAYWGNPWVLPGDPAAYARIDAEAPDLGRFDAEMEAAVKRFQRRHLLDEDGVVGGKTRRALNASVRSQMATLRVNLERARWMQPVVARRPGVWVDIAGYRLHYARPDGERWSSRVIVGRAGRETPVLHSAITHLTVNPTWTVPPTIWREDALPRIRRDPGYLRRRNMQVVGPDGARLDPERIDWQAPGNVMLRQSAGPGNPLGRVVVRFPNSQLIYLHDTPSRGLFKRDRRALSSGCVRVEGVRELVRMLLADTGSRYRLDTLLERGQSDLNVNLPERIPVALVYLTAWPDESGEVTFRPDIYRRDEALRRAL
ncbi:L,D-transpeptidase family protein [Halomonas piscis]|uniref:L,D-transpeptidase family protein n=1 Tax=Halomonas piscis TaxID=3031727 RepID=UPI00289F1E38|nr:L,D-transpeptidase family protein [Halomonas piscis]